MEIKITNLTKQDNYYDIEINSGEVKFYIPFKGEHIDLLRSKVQILVPRKYTAVDIHVIQQKVFKMLVDVDYVEIE